MFFTSDVLLTHSLASSWALFFFFFFPQQVRVLPEVREDPDRMKQSGNATHPQDPSTPLLQCIDTRPGKILTVGPIYKVAPFHRSTRTPEARSIPIKAKSQSHQDWLHTVLNVTTPPEPTITKNLDDMQMEDSQVAEDDDADDVSTKQIKLLSPEPSLSMRKFKSLVPSLEQFLH